MRNPILVLLAFALAAVPAAVSCNTGGGGGGSGGSETVGDGAGGSGGSTGVCSSMDFEAQVIAFCKTQNPPSPGPGEMGASCVDGTQCNSNYCLEPFGGSPICTILCPNGNECPVGYSCQDTGAPEGAACYQDVCIYGGVDASDCTANLLAELDNACTSDCTAARVHGWMDCLAGAGRLCSNSDADEKCGVERGLIESCCISCSSGDW